MIEDLKAFQAKIQEDEELQKKITGIIKGSTSEEAINNCISAAAELGYNITPEDLQDFADEYQANLSDEDLDKVSGGITPAVTVGALISFTVCFSFKFVWWTAEEFNKPDKTEEDPNSDD